MEEARALVAAEESRLGSQQTQATTVIAAVGVIASVGATLLVGFHGRKYEGPSVVVSRTHVSFVLVAAVFFGFFAVMGLLTAGFSAVGALRTDLDPERAILPQTLRTLFPDLLGNPPEISARSLLSLLASRLERIQEANARASEGLYIAVTQLGLGLVSGLIVAVVLAIGTTPTVQETRLLNTTAKTALIVKGTR